MQVKEIFIWGNNERRTGEFRYSMTITNNMAKILSKFGELQLVMVNYACSSNQSETAKYFE